MNKGIYIILTGGGSEVLPMMLTKGGASEYFIGAEIPYHESKVQSIVNEVWDTKMVSERTAHQIAIAAYGRAAESCTMPIGIGVTASLCRVEGEREGRINEAYIAAVYRSECGGMIAGTIKVDFDTKNRAYQEQTLAVRIHDVVHALLYDLKLNGWHEYTSLLAPVDDWLANEFQDSGDIIPILCGSFNPMHKGHVELYNKITDHFDIAPIVEISIQHHHKVSISPYEFQLRKHQIQGLLDDPVVVRSTQPLYIYKHMTYSDIFPGKKIVFVVGADVFLKIDPVHVKQMNIMVIPRSGQHLGDRHLGTMEHNITVDNQISSSYIRLQERSNRKR